MNSSELNMISFYLHDFTFLPNYSFSFDLNKTSCMVSRHGIK